MKSQSPASTFDARVGTLGDLDGASVAAIIHAAADVALMVDEGGIVRDIAFGSGDANFDEAREWLGREWQQTVTPESRTKVKEMLAEVAQHGVSQRRQVNHRSVSGPDIPVAYTAIRLGRSGTIVAIGRDLRGLSMLQQRLVEAQQAMERDYWRMRHIETRYRLLFQLSSEAVIVADATTLKIVDANPAAGKLLDLAPKRLIGRTFPVDFDSESERSLDALLANVRASGRTEELRVRLDAQNRWVPLGASLVRQDNASLFLLRLMPEAVPGAADSGEGTHRLLDVIQSAPDAFVVTDVEGRILSTNRAFLDLAQLATEEQVRGQPLGRWFGRPGADLPVLLATLREHGVVRLFSTGVRGEYGSNAEVELSAVLAPSGGQPVVGLTIRDVGRRLASGPQGARDLTRAVEQLTGLVGRVQLRDLVRDTTDLVERHFIEAALELTEHNRTSAAEVLGVSRQSLYVKLRRYQLGNIERDKPDEE